jgi:hypothetical protein
MAPSTGVSDAACPSLYWHGRALLPQRNASRPLDIGASVECVMTALCIAVQTGPLAPHLSPRMGRALLLANRAAGLALNDTVLQSDVIYINGSCHVI